MSNVPNDIMIAHAMLHNWEQIGDRLQGWIFFDRKGRFKDSEPVFTSTVTKIEDVGDMKLAHTRNTVYLLGKHADA